MEGSGSGKMTTDTVNAGTSLAEINRYPYYRVLIRIDRNRLRARTISVTDDHQSSKFCPCQVAMKQGSPLRVIIGYEFGLSNHPWLGKVEPFSHRCYPLLSYRTYPKVSTRVGVMTSRGDLSFFERLIPQAHAHASSI